MNPFQEFLSCQQDFAYFADKYLKIVHPVRGLIPLEIYGFQKELLEIYEKKQFVAVIKFRQGGFSTLTVLYGLWKCMFEPGFKFYFACKTEKEAIHLGKIVDMSIERFPSWFTPKMEKNTQTEKIFSTTASSMSFGSIEGLRGRDFTHLAIDEAAFIPNMDERWRSVWPSVEKARIYVVSTTNGIGNWFEEICTRAEQGTNRFYLYHANYKDHPIYADEAWAAEIRKNLGEKAWMQEVEGRFVGEEPFAPSGLEKLTDEQVWHKALVLIHKCRMSFENKALIYEMVRRLAMKGII